MDKHKQVYLVLAAIFSFVFVSSGQFVCASVIKRVWASLFFPHHLFSLCVCWTFSSVMLNRDWIYENSNWEV